MVITDENEDLIKEIYSQDFNHEEDNFASVHDQPKEIKITCSIQSITKEISNSKNYFQYLSSENLDEKIEKLLSNSQIDDKLSEDYLLHVFNKSDFQHLQIVFFFFFN